MSFLESIGSLALFLLFGFLILIFLEKKSKKEKEDQLIKDNNRKIQRLLFTVNKSAIEGNPRNTPDEIQRKIKEILDNPLERDNTLQEIERSELRHEERMREHDQLMKENRKFAYKYDELIFKIFDNKKALLRDKIIEGIITLHSTDYDEAVKIFELWKKNYLIALGSKRKFWEITTVLTQPEYKLVESDLTRDDWLILNNKTLEN